MATELTLRRADDQPFGSFEQVQELIRTHFPMVEFFWTTSGLEKIALASERGITFPPEIMAYLPGLPSLLEGVAEGDDFHVTFGLGHVEPVPCLYCTPHGVSPELDRGLSALEAFVGATFQISGDE